MRPPGPKAPKEDPRPEPTEDVPEKVRELTTVSALSVIAEETPAFWPATQPPTPSPRAPNGVVLSSFAARARQ